MAALWSLAALAPGRVAAHGAPPKVLGPLTADAQGVTSVRVSAGLAQRTASGFRYVCPALWGGDESSPAGFVPGGPALVASALGLFVIGDDGGASPHASGTLGRVVGFASSSTALYALASHEGTYALHRVTSDQSEMLWSDADSWDGVSAGDTTLQLVALRGSELWQVSLSGSGQELARVHATVPADTLAIEAHMAGDVPYVVLASDSGTGLTLGRVTAAGWVALASAASNLAGPIATADGSVLVAVDGALASFANEQIAPLDASEFVTELSRLGDQSYASVRAGLRALAAGAFADSQFTWDELEQPEFALVPAERQSTCNDQWQHARFDLIAAGLLDVLDDQDAAVDASAPNAAARPDASADAAAQSLEAPVARSSGGCAITDRASAKGAGLALALALLALAARRGGRRTGAALGRSHDRDP